LTCDSGPYSLADVLARRVPVSAFWRYRVSLQRKKCCQQIIGFDDESFSIGVCIHAKKQSMLGEMLGEQAAYFGISTDAAVEIGREASEFTKQALAKPFTIYTR